MSVFNLMPFDRRVNLEATNPFRDMENFASGFFRHSAFTAIRTDIQDKGDHYLLEADLPGIKKEDIQIEVDGDTLTIQAQRRNESQEKDEEGRYVRCERSYGGFSRSFDISAIKTDQIHAKYENGVLTLELPKKEPAAPTSRRLEIE